MSGKSILPLFPSFPAGSREAHRPGVQSSGMGARRQQHKRQAGAQLRLSQPRPATRHVSKPQPPAPSPCPSTARSQEVDTLSRPAQEGSGDHVLPLGRELLGGGGRLEERSR